MIRLFFLVVFLLALCMFSVQAQIKFEHLETDIGFDNINVLCRDSYGYLWIGNNRQGLMRHNSYTLDVFTHKPTDSSSITNNTIYAIYQDKKNRLWVGTQKGLNRSVYQTGTFVQYLHKPEILHSLPYNTVFSIMEDAKDVLWIVTDSSICHYNEKTDDFHNYVLPLSGSTAFQFCSMVQDKDGRYWVSTNQSGICEFFPDQGKLVPIADPAATTHNKSFKTLYIDKDNSIWICSYGEGLTQFDPRQKTFRHFSTTGDGTGTNGKIVRNALDWENNYLLVGVDQGGVNVLNKTTGTFTYIKGEQELSSDGIYTFFHDKEGILWVGTSRGGINYYNPKKSQFKKYQKLPGLRQNSLPHNLVGCFMEDSEGKTWIGTDGGGITIFDKKKQTFTNFSTLTTTPPNQYTLNVIRSMVEDKWGKVWILTWNEGLWVYDKTTRKVSQVTFPDVKDERFKAPYWNLTMDKKGRFWLSFPEGALFLLNKNMTVVASFFGKEEKKYAGSSPMIHESEKGIFFISNQGVYQFNEQDATFIQIIKQKEVIDLQIDKAGYFYVASIDNGLSVYDKDRHLQAHYLEENGLTSRYLQAIKLDQDDHLWISSINGLAKFDRVHKQFTYYDKEDGLQGNQFFLQSAYCDKDGQLFFGGVNGFSTFQPAFIKPNNLVPPVYIHEIKLLNKPIGVHTKTSRLQQQDNNATTELLLRWNENMITFEFVGVNFTNPNKNQYAYKLENFDTDWIYTDASRRYATYTNLLPGTYVFHVKASNNNGIWNDKGATVQIIIQPPFWREIWFYMLIVGLTLALIYTYIQWSKRKLRKDKELLTQKVAERTQVIQKQHNLLDDKNQELEVQKNEIQSQNEELVRQNEILQEQRDLNAYKSLMIQDLNQNLEKRIQEKTQELTLTINELNKTVSELDRFIYSASHELSAPLKSILGLVYMAQKDPSNNNESDLMEYLQYIERYVLQLEDVMQALIEFSRNSKSEVKLEAINLYKVIMDTVDELKYIPGAEKTEFRVYIPEDVTISTDFIRLKMILNNLLSNSIKYRDTQKENSWMEITYCQNELRYFLSVSDNGIGIESGYQHKIFDMFFRATGVSVGTGLGLYIVKECVHRLHGEIQVQSILGEGTTFQLSFPCEVAVNSSTLLPKN